ncbi:aldolase [Sistotremastrum niveocremeum HHB9708]|uniref:hydroxymethylglutaryl-CoA lyase n=1 Tax=Sistotremastrum niveocremeum HHB9708 TaxID=1314777 RepID=A0A164YDH5_9AGAM|nr:aldolase [Sistotremastrum niveocremeum HHB9708]
MLQPRLIYPVRIVEVGPRDGLQNEKQIVPEDVKVSLINRLGRAGLKDIEAGSFVSPKWVPQMAGTAEVLKQIHHSKEIHYPVLVPNMKGLDSLLSLLQSSTSSEPLTDEIAVFTATTDSFARANTNCTVAESIERLAPVVERAISAGLRVRGYVSMVIVCPFEGKVVPARVREVTQKLLEMGCYEVSLGDTVGMGTPKDWEDMLNDVTGSVNVSTLATHDTFGMAVANVMQAVSMGVRTVDSSVAGLGGCPYSPGATGNVATEDVVYALHGSGYETGVDLTALAETGFWISEKIGRENVSRVGRALRAKQVREQSRQKE